ncbi:MULTISPECIES: hemagglutinin [unclassified Microbacterium]|uniref:hemagglutinin n=1 Tax=unclassified Microbacterium TaxID=2609290 RepID=UPI0012FB7623|nr:hemagglutinin [Microbacterium sp. MAH-37]MVQ42817.1 hemagglutinin [Microbacterium sp. MAH-37]
MSIRTRRRVLAAGLTGCLVAALTLGGAVAANAADGPFSIDGTVADAGALELPDLTGNVKELGPLNSSTTKIGVIHDDAVPTLGLTNPNAQVDLRRAWIDTKKDATTQHDWLYFAWERDSNNGSGFIAFEFMHKKAPDACAYATATQDALIADCNPWANRTVGDFMILWDQQGGSTDLYLRTWTGPDDDHLTLGAPTLLDKSESDAAYGSANFRGEAAVDLTAILSDGTPQCLVLANVIPSTVTGNSDTADYKDTVLAPAPELKNCQSSTVTTPQTGTGALITSDFSIGTGVVGVRDSAVIDVSGGAPTPTGTVKFFLCKVTGGGLCGTGGTAVGSTNVTGTSYPVTLASPVAYVTSAGDYCWRAEYSGAPTLGIPSSSDSRASECFTVKPVKPVLSTDASDDVFLGNTVKDSATLSGTATMPADPVINLTGAAGAKDNGGIVFTLYGPSASACGAVAYTSPKVTVSGDGTYDSPEFTPTTPGTYHWGAVYTSGSANTLGTSHNGDCTDVKENVVVNTVASSIGTAQTWVPKDSATVSAPAGGNLTGSVLFEFFANATCSGAAAWSQTVPVNGVSPQTVSTGNAPAQSASGDFSWRVTYDSTNAAQRDIPASCQEVTKLTITNGALVSSP